MAPETARPQGTRPGAAETEHAPPAYQTPVCDASPLAGKPEHIRPILARIFAALEDFAERVAR